VSNFEDILIILVAEASSQVAPKDLSDVVGFGDWIMDLEARLKKAIRSDGFEEEADSLMVAYDNSKGGRIEYIWTHNNEVQSAVSSVIASEPPLVGRMRRHLTDGEPVGGN